jgi:hypothetical protein
MRQVPVAAGEGGPQRLGLRYRQPAEHGGLEGGDVGTAAVEQGASRVGQRDDQPAPVAAVTVPLDELAPLERGDHVGHRLRGDE